MNNTMNFNGMDVWQTINGVKVISMGTWLEAKVPNYWSDLSPNAYEASGELLKAWCQIHNAHYYSMPKESFNVWEATLEAAGRGCKVVVVENLS